MYVDPGNELAGRITDACLDDLATIRTLRYVSIYGTEVTEDGLRKLKAALPGTGSGAAM